MNPLTDVEWEPRPLIEPRHDPELEAYVRRRHRFVSEDLRYAMACPWLVRALVAMAPNAIGFVHLDYALAELISIVVSQDNSCRYCYAAHRVLLRALGFTDARIARIEEDMLGTGGDPRQRLAMDLARRLSRASPLPEAADAHALVAGGYPPQAVQEIIVLAAVMVAANRWATIAALPPAQLEALPDRWWNRLLMRVMGRRMIPRWHQGSVEPTGPPADDEPFGYLVTALGGLPVGRVCREVIRDAWASTATSRRTKALFCAVVARALNCEVSEAEAVRLASAEGYPPEHTRQVLAHLSGPDLDDVETAILQFARETVRYRPAQIQRRARELHARMSTEQFADVVGIAGLANALCRAALARYVT